MALQKLAASSAEPSLEPGRRRKALINAESCQDSWFSPIRLINQKSRACLAIKKDLETLSILPESNPQTQLPQQIGKSWIASKAVPARIDPKLSQSGVDKREIVCRCVSLLRHTLQILQYLASFFPATGKSICVAEFSHDVGLWRAGKYPAASPAMAREPLMATECDRGCGARFVL
jgi:hypothetical protein